MTERISTAPTTAPPEQGQWTYEDWLRLPDDGYRYEVLDGVLYMAPPPHPEHQRSLSPLGGQMIVHVTARKLGEVIFAPCAVRLPGQPVPVQPDIFFIAADRLKFFEKQAFNGAPDLVVEMLSPSNWVYDRKEKFQAYERAGVREYWIADYRAKTIEVFSLKGDAFVLLDKWGPGETAQSEVLEGFEIAVDEVFKPLDL
ncbi:MAG: Uma2 family endonuclease [Chloroflexi bacterium]|nr:Uma2 family endonuclease [Chloroflexota bacterium]